MGNEMKVLSMDHKFIELVSSGKKTRTARLESKANIGEVVAIFGEPFIITDKRIYPFERLVRETYAEEGFKSPEEFSVELYRIYGTEVYSANLHSHKFKKFDGEVMDKLKANGEDACWCCSRIYSVPGSCGNGEFFCRRGNRQIGSWSYPRREIEVPKRCKCWDGDR